MQPIPILRVQGSHRDAGRAIGQATAADLHAWLAEAHDRLPAGVGWAELIATSLPYRAAAEAEIPETVVELDACADGAGMSRDDLFALGCDEAWHQLERRSEPGRGCTDLAADRTATADGSVLVGHTNDLDASWEERLVAIERRVDGEPAIFTIGVGPLLSIGCNDAGLALGGNELGPNDERVGVPRWLLVRRLVAQRTSADAIATALHPRRASSYNNLVAHRDGTLVSVEASATTAAMLAARDADGVTAHTNHYADPAMRAYEADPDDIHGSCMRLERGRRLIAANRGRITPPLLRSLLSDHANGPSSICRHGAPYPTVFWVVMDPTHGRIDFGRGRPCEPGGQHFAFDPPA